jgi:hypothetical protein
MADMVLSLGRDWEKSELNERIEIINMAIDLFIDVTFKIY